jgi:TPR repeat protein
MEQYMTEIEEDEHSDALEDAIHLRKSDIIKSISDLSLLADKNSKVALFVLGDIFLYGRHGIEVDRAKGEALFLRACELGSLEASYRLGRYYQSTGRHIEAVRAFQRAADGGFSPALCRLGALHQVGGVTKKDRSKSREYFKKSIERGNLIARKGLAHLNLTSKNPMKIIMGFVQYILSIYPHYSQLRKDLSSDALRN